MNKINKSSFETAKDLLKMLEGYSFNDCVEIVQIMDKNLKYRGNKLITETVFNYEELSIG